MGNRNDKRKICRLEEDKRQRSQSNIFHPQSHHLHLFFKPKISLKVHGAPKKNIFTFSLSSFKNSSIKNPPPTTPTTHHRYHHRHVPSWSSDLLLVGQKQTLHRFSTQLPAIDQLLSPSLHPCHPCPLPGGDPTIPTKVVCWVGVFFGNGTIVFNDLREKKNFFHI